MPPPADIVPLWFQCDYPNCNAKYRRKEHLNRHRNHHDKEINLVCPYLTCCDAISGLTIRRENRRRLENLGHVVHVMHGKSVVKVYYHAMPVNIAASSVCLAVVKP
ncbi:hypothetical protein N7532_008222 [Penicillium argentinense]|uniref:C2H2-type domain-containing protein n=1 Tax=Penicillium argentinense TaxID=1131581 RepID=A0A9W9EWY3_9EURO|nr:uncharacterized protein N7532_008222 [Penicillium argentinense]KAJ5089538.1 hypothetical protein N7532_008222 [Penicillium argentinense]